MKNKQKQWRRSARAINLDLGSKHNGRRYRTQFNRTNKYPYPLLSALLKRITDTTPPE